MISAEIPVNETERIKALLNYEILDTQEEENFSDLVKLASQICNTSISLISLIDSERQWFKAKVGLTPQETSRDIAFCSHAILENEAFIVNDALKDHRFYDNPLVTGYPEIRFYAGIPLSTPEGFNIGTLCVIDSQPKALTEHQIFALETIAKQVIAQLELRLKIKTLHKVHVSLKDHLEESDRLNAINKKLISILSHDLRGPLASFISYTQLFIVDELTESEKIAFAEKLSDSLQNTLTLVDTILKWGGDQNEGDEFNLSTFSVKQVAEIQISFLELMILSKKNKVVNQIDDHHFIFADENQVQFIFRNLIQNANKFTVNGTITLQSKELNDFIEFSVSDTGVGIKPEIIPHIFNTKLMKTSFGTNGEKGAGLGLLMCREFVEKLGGEIRAESTFGKGSVFYFTLPKPK